jgi:flagellar biosynthesis/type III secretory pathway protein FliH
MSLVRDAHILKREDLERTGASVTVLHRRAVSPDADSPRRVPREVVDAHLVAKRLLDEARKEADAILERARESAERVAARAAEEARQAEHAKVAALYLALRREEERRDERDLDRTMSLARILAERLLGETLDLEPARIFALTRQALAEAKGATRAVIEASPLDADALRSHVLDFGLPEGALDVKIDPQLSRGSLRVHTNLGTLDVQLTPQLERLAKALRDALV